MSGMGARRRTKVAVATVLVSALAVLGSPQLGADAAPAAARGSAPGSGAGSGAGSVGDWQVRALGGDRYEVSWRAPHRLPVGGDRPTVVGPAGLRIGTSTVAADGRTVVALVESGTVPDAGDLDVVLSGDRLDVRGDDRLRAGAHRSDPLELPGTVTLPVDPGDPGPYAVDTSDYELAPVKLDGMPEPIEMVGHVVEPVDSAPTGPRPLVLFLHGRHSYCYLPSDGSLTYDSWPCEAPSEEIPSHLGYDYVQQVLASQGYATVSVRVNGINAQDYRLPDGGAGARAAIVEAHLDHWVDLAADHQVDLGDVVLVGHSRGGEGVDRASIEIPLSAPYRIAGQVLVAPTDFGNQTAPYVPTVTLLPFCDGDVSDLQGQRFTDVSRDLTTGDTSLKSSVLVMGANHNFFNTEWTPKVSVAESNDDWYGPREQECGRKDPQRLSAAEQRAVGTAYIAGAVHLFAADEQDVLPMFDGTRATVPSIGDAQVLSHAIGGGRDERAVGVDASPSLAVGADTRTCLGMDDESRYASCTYGTGYAGVRPHWPSAYEEFPAREFLEMSWTAAGQSGGLLLDQPIDLSSGRLEVRTVVDPQSVDQGSDPVDLRVRITDGSGASADLVPVGGGGLPRLGEQPETEKFWAQALVVDPSAAAGVDLTDVTQVDLVSASDRGRVWVVDLAAAPSTLAPVPAKRLPIIDVGRVSVPEGDEKGLVTARLPFEVHGDVTAPARLSVSTVGQMSGATQLFSVDLAPGQTSGSIPITYEADRLDDYPRMTTDVSMRAVRGAMTGAWAGGLTVLDDDPMPAVRVRPVQRSVREGKAARWQVTLAGPVDYDLGIRARVVRGPRPPLAADDVPRAWFESTVYTSPEAGRPLWSYRPEIGRSLRPGATRVVLRVPTKRDARIEKREAVTLLVRVGPVRSRTTVWVAG